MVQITAAVSNRPDSREIHVLDSDRFRSIGSAGAWCEVAKILEAGAGVIAEAHPAIEFSQLAEQSCSIVADACRFHVMGIGVTGWEADVRQSIGSVPKKAVDVS